MEDNITTNDGFQQDQNINQHFNNQFGLLPVPNATAVLVLGIISIALCWCYGIVALTCGIIALVLANKGTAIYKANPEGYKLSSYNNLKAGKICAIIGLSLSALMIIYIIIILAFVGATMSAMPWDQLLKH